MALVGYGRGQVGWGGALRFTNASNQAESVVFRLLRVASISGGGFLSPGDREVVYSDLGLIVELLAWNSFDLLLALFNISCHFTPPVLSGGQ